MSDVKVSAMINQKGGVGKTTSVANLGAAIAAKGHDTCLIDLDPQSHLTLHLGIEPTPDTLSIYDVMVGQADISAVASPVADHLWVAPAVIDLAGAEVELVNKIGREQILRDKLHLADLPYEYVIIDCPPSLGLLTLNALAAADEVIIPLQPHFLALQGLGKLLETCSLVQQRINPSLRVAGVIFCMYDTTTRLSGEVADDLANFFEAGRGENTPWSKARIFPTKIRRNIKLAECPSHGQTIFDYEPNSHGAMDYLALAKDFLAAEETPHIAAPAEQVVETNIEAPDIAYPPAEANGETATTDASPSQDQAESTEVDVVDQPVDKTSAQSEGQSISQQTSQLP